MLTFESGKRGKVSHKVLVAEGERDRPIVVTFADTPVAPLVSKANPEAPPIIVTTSTDKPVQRWIGVGMMVIGVAGIVFGIVNLVSAQSDSSSYSKEESTGATMACFVGATEPQPCHVTDSVGRTFADRATTEYIEMGLFGGAGVVLAGVGTVLLLTSFGSSQPTKPVTFTPMLSPRVAGIGLTAHF